MNDGHDSHAQAHSIGLSSLRAGPALGALAALGYALWQMWTAIGLSSGAPLGWRAQLLLLEGGVPLLFAVGFGCAAWRTRLIRRVGWGLIIALVLFLIMWTWLIPIHPLTASYASLRPMAFVAVLDPANRKRLVEAAGRQYSAHLFAFGRHYCVTCGVDSTFAQDAVQDIFVALLNGTPKSDQVLQESASQLKAYLFEAVRRRILTAMRSEERRSGNEGHVAASNADGMAPSPAELYDATELQECIDTALSNCPERAVHAYRLVHDWGLTYKETAAVMGIATQTVGSHVSLVAKRIQATVHAWQSSASEDVS